MHAFVPISTSASVSKLQRTPLLPVPSTGGSEPTSMMICCAFACLYRAWSARARRRLAEQILTRWWPGSDQMAAICSWRHGQQMAAAWRPDGGGRHGQQVANTWQPSGHHAGNGQQMETRWQTSGEHLAARWRTSKSGFCYVEPPTMRTYKRNTHHAHNY